MKRIVFLSIMIGALSVGYGFAETQSACTDNAQTAVCKRDVAVMGMGMMGGMMGGHGSHGDHGAADGAKGGEAGAGSHDMAGHSPSGHGTMMQWEGMSRHVVPMMKSMTGMSQRMTTVMEGGMTPETMGQMSEIMRDMSVQMAGMSDMMQRGSASEEEMHVLHQKLNGTEKALGHIRY